MQRRLISMFLSLSPLAMAAQITLNLYSVGEPLRPGIQARWYVDSRPVPATAPPDRLLGGEQLDLRLANLPPHESLKLRFLIRQDSGATGLPPVRFAISNGRQWTPLDPPESWVVERTFPHDTPFLRIRWSIPNSSSEDAGPWSIDSVSVDAITGTKSVDISRVRHRSGEQRAIVFSATRGMPSHGFLVFENEDPAGGKTQIAAYGFYPARTSSFTRLILLRSVPGEIQDDIHNSTLTRVALQLIVYVDRDQFRAAEAVVSRWRCQGRYRLRTRDCVDLMREVSEALGLEVPVRGVLQTRPASYLRDLIAAN